MNRRAFLTVGAASAVVAGLGGTALAAGPGLAAARAPWSRAGQSFGDPRLDALAFAILAPNPHNRQPWVFTLVGADSVDIHCDLARRLPETDPFDRQITIGFGCMLELLRIAAAEKGYEIAVTPFPDGEPAARLDAGRIATVRFAPSQSVARDPLFAEIVARRSTKEAYDRARPVPPDAMAALCRDAAAPGGPPIAGTVDAATVRQLTDIAWSAWNVEYETPRTRRESIDLMRIGTRAVVAEPDGVDMTGASIELMRMLGLISPASLDRPGSMAFKSGISMYRRIIHSAMGFVWVVTGTNGRKEQLDAGAAWVRINLAAQRLGVATHPLSQALQEFPEMAPSRTALHASLAPDGGTVQMLGRVGYAAFPEAAPRWPLEAKLRRE